MLKLTIIRELVFLHFLIDLLSHTPFYYLFVLADSLSYILNLSKLPIIILISLNISGNLSYASPPVRKTTFPR